MRDADDDGRNSDAEGDAVGDADAVALRLLAAAVVEVGDAGGDAVWLGVGQPPFGLDVKLLVAAALCVRVLVTATE